MNNKKQNLDMFDIELPKKVKNDDIVNETPLEIKDDITLPLTSDLLKDDIVPELEKEQEEVKINEIKVKDLVIDKHDVSNVKLDKINVDFSVGSIKPAPALVKEEKNEEVKEKVKVESITNTEVTIEEDKANVKELIVSMILMAVPAIIKVIIMILNAVFKLGIVNSLVLSILVGVIMLCSLGLCIYYIVHKNSEYTGYIFFIIELALVLVYSFIFFT